MYKGYDPGIYPVVPTLAPIGSPAVASKPVLFTLTSDAPPSQRDDVIDVTRVIWGDASRVLLDLGRVDSTRDRATRSDLRLDHPFPFDRAVLYPQ